ncbi:unnamed protein product [Discula destructiva]
MQLTALSLLALGASASIMDGPVRVTIGEKRMLDSRDLATIQGVIEQVGTQLSGLNQAATSFSGDVAPLQSAADALNKALADGKKTVDATTTITINDAVTLQASSQQLSMTASTLVQSLAAQKSAIEQAGLCDTVRQQSETINTNSQALIDSVVSKVPTEVQSVATTIVGGFTATLQQNSATFAQGNCTNAAGAAPAPGTGGAAAPTPAVSAPPAADGCSAPPLTMPGYLPSGLPAYTPTGATGASGLPYITGQPTGPGGAAPTYVTAGAAAAVVPAGLAFGFAALLL